MCRQLPSALCLHLPRTTWQQDNGQAGKRGDHVSFSDTLNMFPYTYAANITVSLGERNDPAALCNMYYIGAMAQCIDSMVTASAAFGPIWSVCVAPLIVIECAVSHLLYGASYFVERICCHRPKKIQF